MQSTQRKPQSPKGLFPVAAPLLQIAKNCGREDGQVLLRDVVAKGSASGFDASAQTEEVQIVDMFEAGIIDPVKVTRSCVENAASAASVLLMTEAAVADIPEEKKNSSGGGGGMPGGMGVGEDM